MNINIRLIKKEIVYILVLSIFIVLSSKALFHEGFFRTIDDITTVRIVYMEKELLRNNWLNNFPVRMSGELSHNHGYPLYLFYAPLIYYVGAFIKTFFGLSHIVATKYVYVFPLIFGSFTFYFAARQKMSSFPALIAAIFFTLFPYRGFLTYIIGTPAQAWAMAFVPLGIGGLFLLKEDKKIGGPIFAIGYFLTIVSHNLTGLIFSGLVLLYGLTYLLKNKDYWKYFLLALGLSAFYLIPMLYYLNIIRVTNLEVNTTYILQSLVPLNQFLNFLAYQSVSTGEAVLSSVSGILTAILIGGTAFFGYRKLKGIKQSNEVFFWGLLGLTLYILLFEPMRFFWQITFPLTGILQFAWRLLAILVFVVSLFLGLLIYHIKNLYLKFLVGFLAIGISLNFLPAFKPEAYSFFYEYKPEGPCATTSWQDEFLPVWVKGCPPQKDPLEAIKAEINVIEDKSLRVTANVTSSGATELIVNKFYFPGWHIFVEGNEAKLDYPYTIDGLFKTPLAPGKYHVEIVYKKTPIMWLSDLISILSFGVLFYLVWMLRARRNK